MSRLSRREFVKLTAVGTAASPFVAGAAAPTAQEVVDRIKTNLGVAWQATTVDTFKAGDPSTPVTGIVTTSLATIDVMRRAVKAGANMIVTSGPTFYSRGDSPTPSAGRGRGAAAAPPADRVFAAKNEFINANKLVVWRFSDHWKLRKPDPFAQGLVDALGWSKNRSANDPSHITLPAASLDTLAADVKMGLSARGGVRVVGDPRALVRTVGLLPGTIPIQGVLALLPKVDVVIAGEIREWESSEYARDVVSTGDGKALIVVGRSLSEDAGMKLCAQWLESIVTDAPVRWLPAGDPYWRPSA